MRTVKKHAAMYGGVDRSWAVVLAYPSSVMICRGMSV
jgi:hypothetical protein